MTVPDLLEQPCRKSDNATKLVDNLFRTCSNKHGTSSANTTCDDPCYNLFADLRQLVRFYACTRKTQHAVTDLQTSLLNKMLTRCLHAAWTKLLLQVWNKLLQLVTSMHVGLSDSSKDENTRL